VGHEHSLAVGRTYSDLLSVTERFWRKAEKKIPEPSR
jgi:hypothetical protein